MRVGINLLNLSKDRFGGAEQYLTNLIRELAVQGDGLELFLFLTSSNRSLFPDHHKQINLVLFSDLRNPSDICKAVQQHRLDLWFCPLHRSYLPDIPVPTVVTIHDVLHTFYPEFVSGGLDKNNRYYKKYQDAFDAVITVSEFSKASITERLHIPSNKVHVIYPDAPHVFYLPPKEKLKAKIKAKYRLPDNYGFYPASYNPHKNHHNLLKAILLLRDKYNERIPLVLSGFWEKKNRVYESVAGFIKEHALEDQVIILGYIPQNEMPYLYFNSAFLVFPSLHEGFGIPLVEAMRTETPIVCSTRGSIPEIVREAALLFNPCDPEDLATKMMQVSHSKTRKRLISKGKERAKLFSWAKNAQETLRVFRNVVSRS
ncbi:glycosyltransferase family 1 protein [Paenibacillus sp. J2TS4]|uniref:glycosyltransferase family 4 protein n=1 Tax=Paenibacillus sp. J2TS4 TaxID=2807194 RepID=UPI001B0B2459|nr:glycosyltransferase family 1 protein [Paenibacillus sp. J2TS4]GIP31288.1 hypothetical protein J2TS4_04980 [Paenibacillus sp. J2TS4]